MICEICGEELGADDPHYGLREVITCHVAYKHMALKNGGPLCWCGENLGSIDYLQGHLFRTDRLDDYYQHFLESMLLGCPEHLLPKR